MDYLKDISLEYFTQKGTVLDYVLNGISDGIYIVGPDQRIVFWNKGAEELTGYKAEDVLGYCCSEDILNHIDENGVPLCKNNCPLQQTFLLGQPVKLKVFPLHKSGKRFPVMAHMSPIKSKDGKIIAVIEVFRDISSEEEFRILQEKFNNLIRKFVSTATVERVMAQVLSGDEGRSRKRDVTILYMDIVRFSSLFEKNSPEEITRLLNEVFEICEIITKKFYGDVDKFIGDAVMAVFIDANDAVAAASKILSSLAKFNKKRIAEKKEPVNIRIAINSGYVVQAEIGSSSRKDLTVIGDAVNTAVYSEKLAQPNSVLITEATLSRLRDTSSFKFESRVLIKGKKEPISVYSMVKRVNVKAKSKRIG